MPGAELRPGLLLDRDGVINVEVDHLGRAEDVVLIDGVADAIARVNAAGIPVAVVTNQAGIGRGLYGEADFAAVTARIAALLAPARVDRVYHCPHHPDADCACRKPRPGMLREAAAELGLDLPRSIFVGDKRSDLVAARAAGCGFVLVRTGYGAATDAALADAVFADLPAAIDWLCARLRLP